METKAEKIFKLSSIIDNKAERIKTLKIECGQQATKICVLNERIAEFEGVMVIIQTDASAGLATMKNEERPDIQRLLRRLSSLVAGCQIESKALKGRSIE